MPFVFFAHVFFAWVECNTMTPQNTFMRAPTRLACKTFIETIVDHVAQLTGKTPEEVRAINIAKIPPKDNAAATQLLPQLGLQTAAPSLLGGSLGAPGAYRTKQNVSCFQDKLRTDMKHLTGACAFSFAVPPGVPELPAKMFEAIKKSAGFDALAADTAKFNEQHLWRKRGLAAMPTEYSCGWGGACHHGSKVDVYPDGTILCFVTGIELGQGLYTKCAQIAALTLGLEDTSLIEVMRTDTGKKTCLFAPLID
jgi:xanthine dehydrogenase molybdopterin-binding subunit B